MAQSRRFGRKLAIPSTRQILHEYRVFSAQEDAKLQHAAALASETALQSSAASPTDHAPRESPDV